MEVTKQGDLKYSHHGKEMVITGHDGSTSSHYGGNHFTVYSTSNQHIVYFKHSQFLCHYISLMVEKKWNKATFGE